MLTGLIIIISLSVQFVTVFLSLRLIRVTGNRISWILISSSISFMAVRRSINLFRFLSGDPLHRPDLSFEIVGLVTSILMLAGVIWISPLFKSLVHEIAERKRAEEALRKSEKNLSSITSNLAEGIYVFNEEGKLLFMNPEAERLLGWTVAEVNEKGPHNLVHFRKADGTPLPLEECNMHKVIKTGEPYSSTDEVFVRKDGTVFPISVITNPIIEDGKIIASVTAFRDITERKKLEEIIRHQAYHDSLTDLPNRNLFMDHLSIETAEARRNRKKFAVLLLDLDRFKNINDTLGHEAGDKLLKEVTRRIKSCIRESDIVARMGGDEFNILQTGINRAEDAGVLAGKILTAFKKSYMINGNELLALASIGISIYPDDGERIDDLMKNADIAMYHAKGAGRNNFQFYNPAMNTGTLERMKLENSLRRSIERGELRVYYQPQADIATLKINSAEALVRWQHPESGLLEPQKFLPLAEETGFISALDEWVLRTACAQVRAWQQAGLQHVCITVNLSARLFQRQDMIELITQTLSETGLNPRDLDLDITEKVAMQDIEQSIAKTTKLSGLGVKFSIDDFGTGFSSLNWLRKLPVEKLKIDRAFLGDTAISADNRAVISAIISLAHNLNLKVVAEGVESEEQIAFLRSAGCDEIQGYISGRPMPADEFRKLIMLHT